MQLLVAHQILIGSAIALAVVFGLRSMVLFAREGSAGSLSLAAVSLVVAGALGVYFGAVRGRWASMRRAHRRRVKASRTETG
jgi:hypothetical protein